LNLAEEWRHLEGDTRIAEVSGRVQRRIGSAGRRNFFLGLEMPSKNRMLILRVSEKALEGQPNVPDSRGLTVRMAQRDTGDHEAEVELILRDSQHRDIFDLLVRDLVEVAEEPQDEGAGLTSFLARLSDWQELLRRLAPGGLSREGQQGLWGELWVLEEVVAPVTGLGDALHSWRGPLGADQDFQTGAACIEVKTSTAHGLDHLTIASERQLDAPADVALLLVVLSLDSRVGHGRTLPEMVRGARAAASQSGSLHLLNDRLELCGYGVGDAGLYSDIGYSVRSFRALLVEEGFPRIVPGDLQPGVGGVRYSVSMASCAPFLMNVEQPDDLLKGLV
jgi:hypothetical protein